MMEAEASAKAGTSGKGYELPWVSAPSCGDPNPFAGFRHLPLPPSSLARPPDTSLHPPSYAASRIQPGIIPRRPCLHAFPLPCQLPRLVLPTTGAFLQVEKYRPTLIKDIVGNTEAVSRLQVIADAGNMPNLLFSVSLISPTNLLRLLPMTLVLVSLPGASRHWQDNERSVPGSGPSWVFLQGCRSRAQRL